MFTIIPRRYNTPKWQAYVTPSDKAFTFHNSSTIRSLFDLKQALMTEPEDVVNHHIAEGRNDIAVWVKDMIGDEELAEILSQQKHRWGLIVALERQMMRTLNLPPYVAKRWLRKVEYPFGFQNGQTADSLAGLSKALDSVSDETVAFHMERMPNDISKWVADVVGDYELADMLEEASNRLQMINMVQNHLVMLEEAAEE